MAGYVKSFIECNDREVLYATINIPLMTITVVSKKVEPKVDNWFKKLWSKIWKIFKGFTSVWRDFFGGLIIIVELMVEKLTDVSFYGTVLGYASILLIVIVLINIIETILKYYL